MTSWDQIHKDFEPDGALRDIYVAPTTTTHWQRFLIRLEASPFNFRFTHRGLAIPTITSFDQALRLRESDPVLLQITLSNGVTVNCHFFTVDEIELDVDPREVVGPVEVEALRDFVQWLADSVGQRAIVTFENAIELVIFACDPVVESA
jgi:hypothetical protein